MALSPADLQARTGSLAPADLLVQTSSPAQAGLPASSLPSEPVPLAVAAPHTYFADLYSFDWTHLEFRLPAICTIAVALCLFIGVFIGHPSAGLIAAGGAFTVAFGVNQRIADSRLSPMIAATLSMAASTFVGMLAGHHNLTLVAAATVWAFLYGLLTARAAGVAWVGQQAAVFLCVSSAFPASPRDAALRAALTLLGGSLQILIVSLSLRILPELKRDLFSLTYETYTGANFHLNRSRVLRRLRGIPKALPYLSRAAGLAFAVRMAITVGVAAEVYRRLGIQSGYWVPMTALLVQKPAFFETLTRAALRIAGTFAGAYASSLLVAYLRPDSVVLACATIFFAFWALSTSTVNYGLFSMFLTGYIVFLLSLNQLPGVTIAHRRAACTIAGGLIALVIHLDALRRHRAVPAAATST